MTISKRALSAAWRYIAVKPKNWKMMGNSLGMIVNSGVRAGLPEWRALPGAGRVPVPAGFRRCVVPIGRGRMRHGAAPMQRQLGLCQHARMVHLHLQAGLPRSNSRYPPRHLLSRSIPFIDWLLSLRLFDYYFQTQESTIKKKQKQKQKNETRANIAFVIVINKKKKFIQWNHVDGGKIYTSDIAI